MYTDDAKIYKKKERTRDSISFEHQLISLVSAKIMRSVTSI